MATRNASRKTPEQIAAEHAAELKARKQQQTIGIIAVIVIIAIISMMGFFIWRGTQPKTASVSPSFTTGNGAIMIVDGKVDMNGKRWDGIDSKKENTINHLPIIANGQDPLCPGCGAIEREVGDTIEYWSKHNQVVYKQWPLSILDRLSDGTRYSTRVAADFYRFAELSPENYLKFISLMYEEGIQPKESAFVNIDDSKIQEYGRKAGLTDRQAKQLTDGKYEEFVEANTSNLSKDKSLWRDAGDGTTTFMTPLLVLDGKLVQDYSTDDMNKYIADRIGLKVPSETDRNAKTTASGKTGASSSGIPSSKADTEKNTEAKSSSDGNSGNGSRSDN